MRTSLYLALGLLFPYQLAFGAWPSTPLSTSGRWIVNSAGTKVTYAGVNWPGAADTMIPEGLQYSSIENIVAKIKSLGLNVIRLTYAIEMIDDIYENGGNDVPLLTSFTNALGSTNGPKIYNDVLANNPSFTDRTTRLEVIHISSLFASIVSLIPFAGLRCHRFRVCRTGNICSSRQSCLEGGMVL